MEKLENTLKKVDPEDKEIKFPAKAPLYQGLKLIEERIYGGGTSIKYWM